MTALIVLLILAGIACLLGGAWTWLIAFAAGMSDAPNPDNNPSWWLLFGLPALAVVFFVLAFRLG
jgi:uncharacterized membrane protein YidH (DUF202 family)